MNTILVFILFFVYDYIIWYIQVISGRFRYIQVYSGHFRKKSLYCDIYCIEEGIRLNQPKAIAIFIVVSFCVCLFMVN